MEIKKPFYLILLVTLCAFQTQKERSWVAIGDSITYLNDHPDETGDRVKRGYMDRVCDQVPGIHVVNQGHNGWTSGGIAESIDKLNITPADIYTIFLGTNDWWAGRRVGSLQDYETNAGNTTIFGSFRIIINKLKSLNNQAKIILITPMQRGDFVYVRDMKNNAYGSYKEKDGQTLEQVANAVLAIGAFEHFVVVDLYHTKSLSIKHLVKFKKVKDPSTGVYNKYTYPAYTNIPFNPATDDYPYPADAIDKTYDGLHPSDEGNEIIAGLLVKEMKKIK